MDEIQGMCFNSENQKWKNGSKRNPLGQYFTYLIANCPLVIAGLQFQQNNHW